MADRTCGARQSCVISASSVPAPFGCPEMDPAPENHEHSGDAVSVRAPQRSPETDMVRARRHSQRRLPHLGHPDGPPRQMQRVRVRAPRRLSRRPSQGASGCARRYCAAVLEYGYFLGFASGDDRLNTIRLGVHQGARTGSAHLCFRRRGRGTVRAPALGPRLSRGALGGPAMIILHPLRSPQRAVNIQGYHVFGAHGVVILPRPTCNRFNVCLGEHQGARAETAVSLSVSGGHQGPR